MRHRDPRARVCAVALDSPLHRGRECYAQRAWFEAWQALSRADQQAPLEGDDLERLAMAAYLLGRDDDYLQTLDRAHGSYLAAGDNQRAVRCAFWLGLRLYLRGDGGRATGWFARAHRLLECQPPDCVERGYLMLSVVSQQVAAGDLDAAVATAAAAAEIGDRFADADLSASARQLEGHVLIEQGEVARGLALLDEAMLAVATGELTPLVSGLAYCNAIDGCQLSFALARAREWTDALTEWCAEQPDMVAFSGVCLVHRAEIMQLRGMWAEALQEARRAFDRCRQGRSAHAAGLALYQQGEVQRLRGEFAAAEEAYRRASRCGCDPQPGLALLRAAQGDLPAAANAVARALGTTADRWQRVRLLPAGVEIALAAGDVEAARRACAELDEIAGHCGGDELDAVAAAARSALVLAQGDARAALVAARRALQVWQRAEAPYLAARVRTLAGLACRALGDDDGSRLELDAARAVFEQLGAMPDVARIDALTSAASAAHPHGLTPRELQVLRLVAAGKTNKAIAGELFLSEKTVDRHVSNILAKLDVPSRTAATARAYELQLIRS
ncbi:helix-turn-helix transcriptional regulator [Variovorax sp. WS11]|nr:helix-turn-helix transcriptional regulator [Variovorax sp. WS11]PSL85012.1 helix-turn-helix transcriptional regulator [Variovorax sp. WS11]